MFVDKRELIAIFESEFEAWERLLTGLSLAQLMEPGLPGGLTVKDTMAHLGAWQQRTIAQLEAALHGHEPHFPPWPVALDEEESSDAVDRANAWILETHRHRPWSDIYREWREGFLRFLELVRAIPEADLLPGKELAWMAEYQLWDGLSGAYEHHHAEHRRQLEASLSSGIAIHEGKNLETKLKEVALTDEFDLKTKRKSSASSANEKAELLKSKLEDAIGQTGWQKTRNRQRASYTKVAAIFFSSIATVLLGLQIAGMESQFKNIAFVFSALVTLLTALEPYFNFRALWVEHEFAQSRFLGLRDDLHYYLAGLDPGDINEDQITEFQRKYQNIWDELNKAWVEYRRKEK